MARAVGDFSLINPGEVDLFTFDFANNLIAGDSILSATWTISVASGTDSNANSYKIGDPSIFGTKVTQKCSGGFLPGVQYIMLATVSTRLGLTQSLWAYLWGEAIGC